ncbi:sugar phosphate isomerase/epimerase [Halobacteria archaeon AArc-dxtr1]|nr:sugar phosphate isomerase/epimerase [Halobacteria archaeon AArc-dxtr1]
MSSEHTDENRVRNYRRRFLQGIGAAGLTGLTAGCLGDDNGDDDGDDTGDDSENGNGAPANFEVDSLEPGDETVTIGESVDVSATIENTGDEEDVQTVSLLVDGDEVDDDEVELGGGDDDEVAFTVGTIDFDEGEYEYEITTDDDSQSAMLTVEQTDISTQFFSYNGAGLDTVELIYESGDHEYDAIEPFGGPGNLGDVDDVQEALDETGLRLGSSHINIDEVEDDPGGMADIYGDFGEIALIEPYYQGVWDSRDDVIEFAERVNDVADEMEERGLQFGYHNHDFEFVELDDGEIAYDVFAEHVNENVHLQLDVGWVVVGGADPVAVIERYPEKIKSIHMKDMTEDGDFVEIGEGAVDMQGVADAAREVAGVDYLVYEYDNAPEPLESLEFGAEYLQSL